MMSMLRSGQNSNKDHQILFCRDLSDADTPYNGGKIFYLDDNMMRLEQVRGKLFQIQPFVWRAFQGAIVEVETIDIDGSSHCLCPKKAGAAEATPRPRSKPWG